MTGFAYMLQLCNLTVDLFAELSGIDAGVLERCRDNGASVSKEERGRIASWMGIDEKYLGEITEKDKEALRSRAAFRYFSGGREYYLFRYDAEKAVRDMAYFLPVRDSSLDEQVRKKEQEAEDLLKTIRNLIFGSPQNSLEDRLATADQGVQFFRIAKDLYIQCGRQAPLKQMDCYEELCTSLTKMTAGLTEAKDAKAEKEAKKPSDECSARIAEAEKEHEVMDGVIRFVQGSNVTYGTRF